MPIFDFRARDIDDKHTYNINSECIRQLPDEVGQPELCPQCKTKMVEITPKET